MISDWVTPEQKAREPHRDLHAVPNSKIVDVAQRLNAKRGGKGYIAKCPAHDDHKASLSISEGRDGRVLLKCFAGCRFDQIVSAAGFVSQDLFPEPLHRQSDNGATTRRAATFDWQARVDAFTPEHQQGLCEWRGFSPAFVSWLRAEKLIGLHEGCIAFPVHEGGHIVGCHYRPKDGDPLHGFEST